MRKCLILLVFIIPFICYCQTIKVDKVAHFGVGFASGAITTSLLETISKKDLKYKSLVIGSGLGITLGLGKEVFDCLKGGKFDVGDFLFTAVGSVLGSIVVEIPIKIIKK